MARVESTTKIVASRVCGGCTACCDILPVVALNKPANVACVHCDSGCTIYADRPPVCSDFECAYLQSKAPLSVRPDNCGIIFERMSDRIFYGTVFKVPTRKGVAQVQAFVAQGFSVALASNTGRFPVTFSIAESHALGKIREEFRGLVEARV